MKPTSRRIRPPTATAPIAAETQSKPSPEPEGSGTATATGSGSYPIATSRVSGERRSWVVPTGTGFGS
jgi:hypothetical protein